MYDIIVILLMEKKEAHIANLSKKYNLEVLNDYNFDNFTFDINLGDVSEKDAHNLKREEADYNEELRKEEEAKKKARKHTQTQQSNNTQKLSVKDQLSNLFSKDAKFSLGLSQTSGQVDITTDLKDLEYYEDCIQTEDDYLLDTFVDPIDIIEYRIKTEENRTKLVDRQFLTYFIETPVTQIDSGLIEENIRKIHI